MQHRIADISIRKAALIAGLSLLIMTIVFLLSDLLVFKNLIDFEDAAATTASIISEEKLFRVGVFGFFIVAVLDVVAAWALYVLLKPVNNSLSLLTAWFRLAYAAMLGIALLNFVIVLELTGSAGYLPEMINDQLQEQVLIFTQSFYTFWHVGLILFGFHLTLLGYLVFRSSYIPGIFGILLLIAGLSYLADYSGKLLIPGFSLAASTIFGWGELIFMFWLLIKGRSLNEVK